MFMKRIYGLLVLALFASACSSEDESKGPLTGNRNSPLPITLSVNEGSLINSYVYPTDLDVSLSNDGKIIMVRFTGNSVYSRLLGQEWLWWGEQTPSQDNYAQFEALSASNGDTGFNGAVEAFIQTGRENINACLSQPIASIEVSSSAAWAEHPAGTQLNDMIRIFSPRYAEVFDSEYELVYRNFGHADAVEREQYPPRQDFETEYSSRNASWKLLTELDKTDLQIFPASFSLKSLPSLPLFGQQITVKVTFADGSVLTGTCRE